MSDYCAVPGCRLKSCVTDYCVQHTEKDMPEVELLRKRIAELERSLSTLNDMRERWNELVADRDKNQEAADFVARLEALANDGWIRLRGAKDDWELETENEWNTSAKLTDLLGGDDESN